MPPSAFRIFVGTEPTLIYMPRKNPALCKYCIPTVMLYYLPHSVALAHFIHCIAFRSFRFFGEPHNNRNEILQLFFATHSSRLFYLWALPNYFFQSNLYFKFAVNYFSNFNTVRMYSNEIIFSNSNNLHLGDRVIRDKGVFSKHHGIYVGIHNNVPLVAENQANKGVQYVSLSDFLNGLNLTRIEKFNGNEYARYQIIPRINALLGSQYNLVNFNCEHFAELIQNGKPESKQIKTAVGLGLIALLGFALFSKE